jgi:ribosomal protein L37AE/L43A
MIIVEAAMKVECPYCKEKYNIKRSQLGKRAVCNMCEQSFVLYVEGVEPPKPRKKNPKLVKRIVSVIVLLAVLGGGAYWLFALNGLEKVKALISHVHLYLLPLRMSELSL